MILKKFLCVLLALTAVFAFCVSASAAGNPGTENFIELLDNPDGRTVGISFRGDTKNFPENTVEGVISAADTGIDAVLVDVRQTKDGILVAFADDTTARMCADKTVYTVAGTDYETLSSLKLKNGEGGVEKQTQYGIPALSVLLDAAKLNGIGLVLACDVSLLPAVSKELSDKNMLENVCVTVNDSVKNISAALSQCENKPHLIGTIRSNIIFSVTSFEDKMAQLGASAVCLKTTNRYGVNYYPSHLARLTGKIRAAADLSDRKTAGNRLDCEKWWDDLISRGYSVIITKEPELFAHYINETADMHAKLEAELENAENFPLPSYKTEIFNDYKKAYDDAVSTARTLVADDASCRRDLFDAYSELIKAVNDLNLNYDKLEEGTADLNVTPVSIFLCIFAVALVVCSQLYVYKKKKK